MLFVLGLLSGTCEGRGARRCCGAADCTGVARQEHPGGHLAKHPLMPLAGPSPSALSHFSWEASHVPAPRTQRAYFLGRCYFAAILHFLSKKLQSLFFNTYLLKLSRTIQKNI